MGHVTDKHFSRSYTITTPHSTIRRNRTHIRRAAPPPTVPNTPPILLRHNLLHHHNPQRSEPTDQPTQQAVPSSKISTSRPDPSPHPRPNQNNRAHLTRATVRCLLKTCLLQSRLKLGTTNPK